MKFNGFLAPFTALLMAITLGCGERDADRGANASVSANVAVNDVKDTIGAELTGYNHTEKTIGAFYVNGQWGGNITPGSGGGKFVCCARFPRIWHAGDTVKVAWEDENGEMHSRDVPIPRYDPKAASIMNVHFLRDGSIKVFAVDMTLRSRQYPLTGPESELKQGVPIERVGP